MGQIICNLGDYLQVIQYIAMSGNDFILGTIDSVNHFFLKSPVPYIKFIGIF